MFSNVGKKPVVFLQHGLFCASHDFVMAPPNRGLGKSKEKMGLLYYSTTKFERLVTGMVCPFLNFKIC